MIKFPFRFELEQILEKYDFSAKKCRLAADGLSLFGTARVQSSVATTTSRVLKRASDQGQGSSKKKSRFMEKLEYAAEAFENFWEIV